MDLGLVVDPRLDRSWEEALDLAVANGLRHVEPCGGGHVPTAYLNPRELAVDSVALQAFAESLRSRDLQVPTLGCYGNPVHPDSDRAQAAHEDFTAMCSVAAELGVGRIAVTSGLPGGGPGDRAPNWIVPSVYPDFENAYRWQWEERLIPYWQNACEIARECDVTICIEPIGGFMVYNAETLLRLRDACGETIGVNVDPSHLWWMGIDPLSFIDQLKGAIAYAHAKDVALDPRRTSENGIVPACRYDEWEERSWVYRAVGFGHPEMFWKEFFSALRRAGYDDVVSVEIEDPFMTMDEAVEKSVEFARRALPREPIPEGNWFEKYEWESAEIE